MSGRFNARIPWKPWREDERSIALSAHTDLTGDASVTFLRGRISPMRAIRVLPVAVTDGIRPVFPHGKITKNSMAGDRHSSSPTSDTQ